VRRGRLAVGLTALIAVTAIAAAAVIRSPAPPADRVTSGPVQTAIKELDLIRPTQPKPAEDFTVPTARGRTFRLSEQRGKIVFINFWATWCPPCREEMPALERLYERTKHTGVEMLAISVDTDPASITPFLGERQFTFTVGLDPTMSVATTYGVRGLPASFIVDREGRLAAVALGPRAWDSPASQALMEGLGR
jgi:peroxiredoxin